MSKTSKQPSPWQQRVIAEQVRAHYSQIPAMAIAPTLGGLFTAWVLWNAVRNDYLVVGLSAVAVLSAARLLLYRRYFAVSQQLAAANYWKTAAVLAAAVSGCIWGSAAPFLYPPDTPGYDVYLLILLTLLPIVPVAALAVYMPAFYAYYIPCIVPFIVSLALAGSYPERMTALLLIMMMGAMVTFARRYSEGFAQAIELRLQLAEKSHALELAIQHKSRFIAAASHDLRAPVHAIGLFLESLKQRTDPTGTAEEIVHIERSLRTQREMLDDMLEVSRLEANVVKVNAFPFAAGDLLRKLKAEYAALASRQGLKFRLHVREAVIFSDPLLLERILRNLLSNALKFTRRGGVALICRPVGARVRLQVLDTGTGIRVEDLDQIFEEFTQLDNAERDSAKGLGLGLAIGQRMARLLGHTLNVRSEFGHGSNFTVEVAADKGPALPLTRSANISPISAPDAQHIVVIDDDEAVRASMLAILQRWGHRVTLASAGAQAQAALLASGLAVDLLIVDYRLADGEFGWDAIAMVEQTVGHKVPTIFITGDTAPEHIRECLEAGYALLHKPVDPKQLAAWIASAAGARPGAQRP